MDVLGVKRARREGGAHKHERSFYDFTINGKALLSRLPPHDHIGVFGWLAQVEERRFARYLLGRERSPLRSEHAPLYICPECADLGCGVISVEVSFEYEECVVWSEMGWDDPGAGKRVKQGFPEGPRDLWFDRVQYESVLAGFL
jgi:hypothetical protein